MKYSVPKELITEMEDIKEGELSVVSTEHYNMILNNTKPRMDQVKVGINLVIRNTFNNEVMALNRHLITDIDLLQHMDGIEGYFQIVYTLDKFLRGIADIKNDLMARTNLSTLGVVYNEEENTLKHIMQLVVFDDDVEEFTDMFNGHNIKWEKIVDLNTDPFLCKFDKMVMSQLKIVNGGQ